MPGRASEPRQMPIEACGNQRATPPRTCSPASMGSEQTCASRPTSPSPSTTTGSDQAAESRCRRSLGEGPGPARFDRQPEGLPEERYDPFRGRGRRRRSTRAPRASDSGINGFGLGPYSPTVVLKTMTSRSGTRVRSTCSSKIAWAISRPSPSPRARFVADPQRSFG